MKQRVLIVDDDPLVADTLNMIFRVNGYDSEAAYSAAEGLERARTFAPVLLLCDVTIPEQRGVQLAQAVQRELPQCKLLMFSASLGSGTARIAQQLPNPQQRPLKLLTKPCRPELLLREAYDLLETA